MSFKGLRLLLCAVAGFGHAAPIADNTLILTPQSCVALHQGRTCYRDIAIRWQLPKPGDICLYKNGEQHPLKCWKKTQYAAWRFEFADTQTAMLTLRQGDNILAEGKIEVSWVYRSKKSKRNWRLF